MCYQRLLKLSNIAIHNRHGHKNTLHFGNLIASDTDSLSSLRFVSKFDDNTMYYIMINSLDTNLMDGAGNVRSGTDSASENE